jgi:pimeloyl-ACP methyl ester carboxylesterase
MTNHFVGCKHEYGVTGNRVWFSTFLMMLLMVFLAGCATPVGTRNVGIKKSYEHINSNAIKDDTYSDASRTVLHRFFLEEVFKKDPGAAIETLHDLACEDDRRDLLFALSELTYLSGRRASSSNDPDILKQARSYYLGSAVYAYLYLLGDRGGDFPDPYDRRFRVASDLYNTALAQALIYRKQTIPHENSIHPLPVGTLFLELNLDRFPHDLERLETIIPADKLTVYGLTVRDRHPGLGAPFIAVEKKIPGIPIIKSIPGTLFLKVEGNIRDLRQGVRAKAEIFSSYEKRVTQINDKVIPLENDLSAQLAYALNQPFLWDIGSMQFFKGAVLKSGIYQVQPYSPDRIPVIFVHGTFSSPVWWAEMFNTLRADPILWEKYQFWFYLYDSSKQLVLSAVEMRDTLSEKIKSLDPQGKNNTLKEIVVVGHSQGGLLTKLTAVETGDTLIRAVAKKDLNQLNLTVAEKAMFERYLIYSPLPFVRRVVFISTPHRGSYLANNWVRQIVQRIVSFPRDVLKTTGQLLTVAQKMDLTGFKDKKMVTSIDAMSPSNEGLLALADIPLAPGIIGHSIISIKGDEMPPEGADGVVRYTSAHVDYVQSEFIVRTGHSSQDHPLVIEEIRRILLEHLERQDCLKAKYDCKK